MCFFPNSKTNYKRGPGLQIHTHPKNTTAIWKRVKTIQSFPVFPVFSFLLKNCHLSFLEEVLTIIFCFPVFLSFYSVFFDKIYCHLSFLQEERQLFLVFPFSFLFFSFFAPNSSL